LEKQILPGVLLGLVAVAAGAVTLVTAVLTRRRRADIAETYAITGGIAYTVAQFGCGGVLVLAGLAFIAVVVFAGR